MNNIVDIINGKSCFGCGVCAASCPKSLITMKLNGNGFYTPTMTAQSNCIECNICKDVCSFCQDKLANEVRPLQSWAAWSNDESIRALCSSGGVGYEIGKVLIENGYKVVGCRYNVEKQRAEHYEALTIDDLALSIGSKYIQSFTEESFKKINRKQKYLVVGTPCQIDSFRRLAKKFHCEDNLVLMDFFCHCVPSYHAWSAYLKMAAIKVGQIKNASWRNKDNVGWHDSWLMHVDGEFGSIRSRWSRGDIFYKLFLGDVCHGPQCEKECKYKYNKSSADLRIGDLWGKTYHADEKGTSALVAFTSKGVDVVKELRDVTLVAHPFEVVAEGQMKENVKRKSLYNLVMFMLKHQYSISGIPFRSVLFVQRVISYIGRKIK